MTLWISDLQTPCSFHSKLLHIASTHKPLVLLRGLLAQRILPLHQLYPSSPTYGNTYRLPSRLTTYENGDHKPGRNIHECGATFVGSFH